MTSIIGSASTPKDFKFENILKQKFTSEKIDQVVYYDNCLLSTSSIEYGKVVITRDILYGFVEGNSKFMDLAYYRDIEAIDLVPDVPDFIFGPLKSECIHVKVTLRKFPEEPQKTAIPTEVATTKCCAPNRKQPPQQREATLTQENNQIQLNDSLNGSSNSTRSKIHNKSLSTVHIYVMNSFSPILGFLKKAHLDYLIRRSLSNEISSYYVSSFLLETSLFQSSRMTFTQTNQIQIGQSLANKLFDDLSQDIISTNQSNLALPNILSYQNQDGYYRELYYAGLKYLRIRILFWTKSDLFPHLVRQFSLVTHRMLRTTRIDKSDIETINVLMDAVTVFLIETDHLLTKYMMLQKDCGKYCTLLVKSVLNIICHLHHLDLNDESSQPPENNDEGSSDVDMMTYNVVIRSVSLLYYILRSLQVPYRDKVIAGASSNPLSVMSIVDIMRQACTVHQLEGEPLTNGLEESYSSLSSDKYVKPPATYFELYLEYVLYTIFPWLFPQIYKLGDTLSPRNEAPHLLNSQIVTIFQLLNSLQCLVSIAPDFLVVTRSLMSEEFAHFDLNPVFFPANNHFQHLCSRHPLLERTANLVQLFHRNVISSENEDFMI